MTAALTVVPTPIGNLGDITERSRRALADASVIACEDTRVTRRLLHHLGIVAPRLVVVNDHTERDAIAAVCAAIDAGERVVLVSDAGTPAVSDPGWRVARAVIDVGGEIDVLPGASAAIVALVVSGLPTDRFVFEGFVPRKGRARAERLDEIAAEPRTTVLYEAPHRVARTLADLAVRCGPDRAAAVCRELTKLHQEVRRAPLAELVEWAEGGVRGEVVVVLAGAPPPAPPDADDVDTALRRALAEGLSRRDAARRVAGELGVRRSDLYERTVEIWPSGG